jgi:ubiquinone/menaquinone biosynthesis C-methylase UbiE
MKFSERFTFSDKDREFKSWWYVNIFILYIMAFELLSKIKNSSYVVPKHYIDRFWRDCLEMMPVPQKVCLNYFSYVEANLRKYTDWHTSDWVASVAYEIKTGKKVMLIYNTIQDEDLSLKIEDVPADWVITTDRRYVQQADAVVIYLPALYQEELENDLEKPEGQIWVSWYQESEKDHPLLNDSEIRDTFDIWICCANEEQKEHLFVGLCRDIDEKLSEKDKVLCPCCGKTFGRFVHFEFNRPYVYDFERYKEYYKNTICPNCFSLPRHRIACSYFDSNCIEGNILMFGAEKSLKKYFDRNNNRYTTADLFDQTANLKIDIQEIQLPDEQWDLIICNHVLEHVPDYKKALMELNRILKKGGILEITVPTDRDFETVYEAHGVNVTSTEERIRTFGQYDHLRIFGNNFEKILTDSGFSVEIIDGKNLPVEIVGVIGPANYDDNRVYICKKIINPHCRINFSSS